MTQPEKPPTAYQPEPVYGWLCISIAAFLFAATLDLIPDSEGEVNAPDTVIAICGFVFLIGGVMLLRRRDSKLSDTLTEKIMPVIHNKNYLYGVIITMLPGLSTFANNDDVIADCAKIVLAEDRILCLEEALRGLAIAESRSASDVLRTSGEPGTPPPPAQTQVSPPPVEGVPAVSDDVPIAEVNSRPDQVQETEAAKTQRVVVTSVSKNLSNRYVFETEDGTAWVQTDHRTVRYRNTPFTADIRPASLGSYFLKPHSGGVSVRVRKEN